MKCLALACVALATACSAECRTADLDAKYALDLIRQCDTLPLSECPAAKRLGDEYERAAAERIEACRSKP